jgi:SAM-dependent methyltransferase
MSTEPFFSKLTIENPKRHADVATENRLFPYYAGYSSAFTTKLLDSTNLERDTVVLDPWNGAGTTIQAASKLGLKAVGVDLNPAMVIVAKAALLASSEAPSLVPLAESLLEQSSDGAIDGKVDPLTMWVDIDGARAIRRLEAAINRTLISHDAYTPFAQEGVVDQLSPLAAFFYVALFRTVRCLLKDFIPTNPTWVKVPRTSREKRRPRIDVVNRTFLGEVQTLTTSLTASRTEDRSKDFSVQVLLGSSERLPLADESVGFVLSSPPYCTRIDYAVATAIELAILRYDAVSFDKLRRSLMGTSTVEPHGWASYAEWGATCTAFLAQSYAHPSKASKTYYYKSHLQYFGSLYKSVMELSRVLKKGAACVLVVQDSHYKEIRNDVPTILCEMAGSARLELRRRTDFVAERSMVRMNTQARKYLDARKHVESVICFEKT